MTTEELIEAEIENQIKLGEDLADEKITEDKYNELMEKSHSELERLNGLLTESLEVDESLTLEQQESSKYHQRRVDGLSFSDAMNAKLVILDKPDADKDAIDTFFSQTQFFLEGGKWKSAQREIARIKPTPYVSAELIAGIKKSIDNYVKKSYE